MELVLLLVLLVLELLLKVEEDTVETHVSEMSSFIGIIPALKHAKLLHLLLLMNL